MVELIYCADGNGRYAKIAIDAGFTYGARLPGKVYFDPEFVDQDWKSPDFATYILALEKYKPRLATVLDWEHESQLPKVLQWAKWASVYVSEAVIIIPKVPGGVKKLPHEINGTPVRLGFSYPTGYGEAEWSILLEMLHWPHGVHILGGPPHAALALKSGRLKLPRRSTPQADFFTSALDIRSVDCNYHLYLANRVLVWRGSPDGVSFSHTSLKEANGRQKWGDGSPQADAPYEAFRRSCEGIIKVWGGAA